MTIAVERMTMVDSIERANWVRVFREFFEMEMGSIGAVLVVEAVMPIVSHFENQSRLVDSGIAPAAAVAADFVLGSLKNTYLLSQI